MKGLEQLLLLNRLREINKLAYYQPYEFQNKFHFSEGHLTPGRLAYQRFLIAANKIGKTLCAAMEVAMHATGRYPDGWRGHKISYPTRVVCGGVTNETVRDVVQKELFGDPEDEKSLGTGSIPKECILKVTRKAGVPNAIDSALIRHKSGKTARIFLRAYEQGWKKFMGHGYDVIWLDEEPPQEIWSQMIRATMAKPFAIIMATFTPEEGMTQLVTQVLNDLKKGQAVIRATVYEAPHMTSDVIESRSAVIPEHERKMRLEGDPLMGSGLVFQFPDEDITCDPFEIPKHWARIIGIDFGWDHPFGACAIAWDRDSDTVYFYADYKESKALPAVHAQVLSKWGDWIPVAWPHDGLDTEKGSGEQLRNKYKEVKVNMLPWKATLPSPDKEEGHGSNSVEQSILEMVERLQEGRLKIFKTCKNWMEEKRSYHRDKGKIVKLNDDTISASRYALMMLRHARIQLRPRPQKIRLGMSNWS